MSQKTASVVVRKMDHTDTTCVDCVARRTLEERLLIESRDGPFREFEAHQWREFWVYQNGRVVAHERNRTLLAKVSA